MGTKSTTTTNGTYHFNFAEVLGWAKEITDNIDRVHAMDDFHHEEIAQKAAIKVWQNRDRFSIDKCTPKGYVAMITSNVARSEYKNVMKEKGRAISLDGEEYGVLDWMDNKQHPTDHNVLAEEMKNIWDNSLSQINERSRKVISMIDDEMTNEEIAAAESISAGAAAKLKFDARQRFEAQLKENGYYEYLMGA